MSYTLSEPHAGILRTLKFNIIIFNIFLNFKWDFKFLVKILNVLIEVLI